MIRLSAVGESDLLEGASAALADALAGRIAEAARAWPAFTVESRRFARFLAARLPGDDDPVAALATFHVADLYLACACIDGDATALATFDRGYLAQLPRLVRAEPGTVDELRQVLATRLLVTVDGQPPRLDRYGGRGPLITWLKVVASRALSNLRRGDGDRASAEDKAASEPESVAAVDPELALIRQRFGVDFHEALAAAFASLPLRERNLLRMHFVERLSIDRLAPIFAVSRATAARHLVAARSALTERTIANLGARLRLAPGELQSLVRQVRSKLDLSLSTILRA